MPQELVLEMKGIDKIYPNGVVANKDAYLGIQKAEIHALLGENGAGKTTLMKILFGIEHPTSGSIFLNGKEVSIGSPLQAIDLGIGMVHQHFMLDERLTVTENIILGMEPKKGLALDYNRAVEMVREVSDKYNFKVEPNKLIMDLSVGKKQKVEILKALIRGAKILILDEPTAVLTPQETVELFEQLNTLKSLGHSIVFISHKLNEVKQICDRATVMRLGVYQGTHNVADVTVKDLSRLMIGREVVRKVEKKPSTPGDVILSVKDLNVINDEAKVTVNDVSFAVRAGEILGVAGVEGNGQRELIDAITGLSNAYTGKIKLRGMDENKATSVKSLRLNGMNHIPEDRLTYGVAVEGSIQDNLITNRFEIKEFNNGIMQNYDEIHATSNKLIQDYQIKTDSKDTLVRMLSGGNMQKVVAAREMSVDMSVLVADQPTRGIDVGTAAFIHDRIVELRDQGIAVLLVSADINEVLEVSDSLIVMYEGEITAYFKDAKTVTEEELGLYMLGLKKMTEKELEGVSA
jgi:general nucleoside transport system ATP-binding protein